MLCYHAQGAILTKMVFCLTGLLISFSVRIGVNKNERNICFMLVLISHVGIEANDLLYSDSAPPGIWALLDSIRTDLLASDCGI